MLVGPHHTRVGGWDRGIGNHFATKLRHPGGDG
jgi:hypothetical protein